MTAPVLFRGKKWLALRHYTAEGRADLEWALTRKPGDYFFSCDGCNRQLAEAHVNWINEGIWYRGRKNKTWLVDNVRFTDTKGRWHYTGSCAFPALTEEGVRRHHLDRICLYDKDIPRIKKLIQALQHGSPFDSHGEWLPEFDISRA